VQQQEMSVMDPKEKQLHALRESLRVSPENVPLRRMVAESLLELARYDDAEKEAKTALQHDADDVGCKAVLAHVYLHKGQVSVGLVLAEDILALSQDDASVWLLHARLLQRSGNPDEARESFAKAIALDPSLRDSELDIEGEASADPGEPESPPEVRVAATSGNASQQLVEEAFSEYPLELPPHADRPPVADRDPELPGFVMEKPPFGFDAVGGMASVKDDVRMKIILPSTNQELYAMYGKKAGGGILLYGPPGCGKTHIARATAGEIEAKFINIGLHDILDMWVGNSEKQLHEVFEYARANAPCVLFFDEVDALAASRTDMRNSASRHTINQFLAELDGVDVSNEGVLVLAATNAPWHLDSAFRRPGRFDEVIFVPPPDAEARAKILEIFLADKPTENLDFPKIATKAKEFSGADLRGLVDRVIEEKLRQAMKTGKPEPIRTKDLIAGLKRQKASTQEWLATAKNYAAFANEGGVYDDIKAYLNLK
jgi:transitional endoplasmic reticulum ATPase